MSAPQASRRAASVLCALSALVMLAVLFFGVAMPGCGAGGLLVVLDGGAAEDARSEGGSIPQKARPKDGGSNIADSGSCFSCGSAPACGTDVCTADGQCLDPKVSPSRYAACFRPCCLSGCLASECAPTGIQGDPCARDAECYAAPGQVFTCVSGHCQLLPGG